MDEVVAVALLVGTPERRQVLCQGDGDEALDRFQGLQDFVGLALRHVPSGHREAATVVVVVVRGLSSVCRVRAFVLAVLALVIALDVLIGNTSCLGVWVCRQGGRRYPGSARCGVKVHRVLVVSARWWLCGGGRAAWPPELWRHSPLCGG